MAKFTPMVRARATVRANSDSSRSNLPRAAAAPEPIKTGATASGSVRSLAPSNQSFSRVADFAFGFFVLLAFAAKIKLLKYATDGK